MKNVEAQYKKAKEEGTDVRGMVVINPGNPTGQLLTIANMQEVYIYIYRYIYIYIDSKILLRELSPTNGRRSVPTEQLHRRENME